jgi:hypothetical protein
MTAETITGLVDARYDGPHTPDTVADAAYAVAGLVRYLNNATSAGNDRDTLKYATAIHNILGGLEAAAHGLDQLLRQLADAAERQSDNPTLYDDRRDPATYPAARTARDLAGRLDTVRGTAAALAGGLAAARSYSVHLGNSVPE